jgi:hypothetical protein
MKKVPASEVENYIGKKVRVVYAVRETANTSQTVYVYGSDITGEVTLTAYDAKKQTVTFTRPNGKSETLSPILLLADEN